MPPISFGPGVRLGAGIAVGNQPVVAQVSFDYTGDLQTLSGAVADLQTDTGAAVDLNI